MTRLIPQRPNNDAGVVFVSLDHLRKARHVSAGPERVARKPSHREHTVGFDVGFIYHIKPVFITKLIPTRVIWIMSGTHSIEVVLL